MEEDLEVPWCTSHGLQVFLMQGILVPVPALLLLSLKMEKLTENFCDPIFDLALVVLEVVFLLPLEKWLLQTQLFQLHSQLQLHTDHNLQAEMYFYKIWMLNVQIFNKNYVKTKWLTLAFGTTSRKCDPCSLICLDELYLTCSSFKYQVT